MISRVGVSVLWGLTNSNTDAVECRHGMAYTEVYHPWWGILFVQPLTLGIVTPLRKVYQCAAPPSATPPQQVIIMQPPPMQPPPPMAPPK